jgi:hypothetical protein
LTPSLWYDDPARRDTQMTIEGAIVNEKGVTFGIVIVKPHVLQNKSTADNLIVACQGLLKVVPVVLMAQDSRGTPTYRGRKDIVAFLASIDFRRIPWKKYTLNT